MGLPVFEFWNPFTFVMFHLLVEVATMFLRFRQYFLLLFELFWIYKAVILFFDLKILKFRLERRRKKSWLLEWFEIRIFIWRFLGWRSVIVIVMLLLRQGKGLTMIKLSRPSILEISLKLTRNFFGWYISRAIILAGLIIIIVIPRDMLIPFCLNFYSCFELI